MFQGYQVGDVYGQKEVPVPEFYGIYIVSDGKLITPKCALEGKRSKTVKDILSGSRCTGIYDLSGISVSQNSFFLIYGEILKPTLLRLMLDKFEFVKQVSLGGLFAPVIITDANMWVPKTKIPMNISPVKGQTELFRLVPTSPLSDGVYALYMVGVISAIEDVDIIMMADFQVGKLASAMEPSVLEKREKPQKKREMFSERIEPELNSIKVVEGQKIFTQKEMLNKLRNVPIWSKKECKEHLNKETERVRSLSLSTDKIERMRYLIPESIKAFKNNKAQKAIDLYKEILSIDPDNSEAFMYLSACYLTLNKPDEALSYAVDGAVRFPHPFYFMHIAEAFAQKGNKKEVLFWLEKVFKSDGIDIKLVRDLEKASGFSKYKKDLDCISLVSRYFGYSVTVGGGQYRVGGDIFTGKRKGRVFIDEKGQILRDIVLAKKIAQAAWVYENIVKAQGLPGSKRVSVILNTHKRLRRYEVAQDILARVSIQALAATISGGTTLSYTIPASLTWRVVRKQFDNLKGFLSLKGRFGLEKALDEYKKMENLTAGLSSNHIDEQTAAEIKELYESANSLELSCGALLTSLMPKRGRRLVEKALKTIGEELLATLPAGDIVLGTKDILRLEGVMNDALSTDLAFEEYDEKLNLAKNLTKANEQLIDEWAKQAVQYKQEIYSVKE